MDCDFVLDYYARKHRELPSTPAASASLLQELDNATTQALLDNTPAAWRVVDQLFEQVLSHPGNTWSRDQLSYRQRQLHFH